MEPVSTEPASAPVATPQARPLPVTLAAYYGIGMGALLLAFGAMMSAWDASYGMSGAVVPVLLAAVIAGMSIVGGNFALQGVDWARWTLMTGLICGFIVSAAFATMPLLMVLAALDVIAIVMLAQRESRAWFRLDA